MKKYFVVIAVLASGILVFKGNFWQKQSQYVGPGLVYGACKVGDACIPGPAACDNGTCGDCTYNVNKDGWYCGSQGPGLTKPTCSIGTFDSYGVVRSTFNSGDRINIQINAGDTGEVYGGSSGSPATSYPTFTGACNNLVGFCPANNLCSSSWCTNVCSSSKGGGDLRLNANNSTSTPRTCTITMKVSNGAALGANAGTCSTTVTVNPGPTPPPTNLPDLTVTNISIPANQPPSTPIKAHVWIKNKSLTTGTSTGFVVSLDRNNGGTGDISCSKTNWNGAFVSGTLGANKSIDFDIGFTTPPSTGLHTAAVKVDSTYPSGTATSYCTVRESDESALSNIKRVQYNIVQSCFLRCEDFDLPSQCTKLACVDGEYKYSCDVSSCQGGNILCGPFTCGAPTSRAYFSTKGGGVTATSKGISNLNLPSSKFLSGQSTSGQKDASVVAAGGSINLGGGFSENPGGNPGWNLTNYLTDQSAKLNVSKILENTIRNAGFTDISNLRSLCQLTGGVELKPPYRVWCYQNSAELATMMQSASLRDGDPSDVSVHIFIPKSDSFGGSNVVIDPSLGVFDGTFDKMMIIFVNGDLSVKGNLKVLASNLVSNLYKPGFVAVVDGNVSIPDSSSGAVDNLDGMFVFTKSFSDGLGNNGLTKLTGRGSLLGVDVSAFAHPASGFQRTFSNSALDPAEEWTYEPKYIDLLRNIFYRRRVHWRELTPQ